MNSLSGSVHPPSSEREGKSVLEQGRSVAMVPLRFSVFLFAAWERWEQWELNTDRKSCASSTVEQLWNEWEQVTGGRQMGNPTHEKQHDMELR